MEGYALGMMVGQSNDRFKIDDHIEIVKDENGVEMYYIPAENGERVLIGDRETFEAWKKVVEAYLPRFTEIFFEFGKELEEHIDKHSNENLGRMAKNIVSSPRE
jgi:hypothetical protein